MEKMNPCGHPHDPRRVFCPACGKIQERGSVRVHTPTDDSRGRALTEMFRGVEAGRNDFQRDVEQRFEREVYEHYRGSV